MKRMFIEELEEYSVRGIIFLVEYGIFDLSILTG